MTEAQKNSLRELVLELAALHADRPSVERAQSHLTLPGPILATALASTYASGWSWQKAHKYFLELGVSEEEVNHAFDLLGEHVPELIAWYQAWAPHRN